MGVDSPNLEGLDAWAFEPRKVEKPWGHELVWAETEQYVGKVLFVKAGESLSLQFHRVKDESWLVQSGRARLELGSAGDAVLRQEVIGPEPRSTSIRAPFIGSPRSRTRRFSRSRRLSSMTSSASRTLTAGREPPSLNTVVVRSAAWLN
jgi:hypothetical protein